MHDWEDIVDCALSQNSGEQELEIIGVYRRWSKLVEADHLINVREANHIGGMLKNRSIER